MILSEEAFSTQQLAISIQPLNILRKGTYMAVHAEDIARYVSTGACSSEAADEKC
jgi:hypothetical protein